MNTDTRKRLLMYVELPLLAFMLGSAFALASDWAELDKMKPKAEVVYEYDLFGIELYHNKIHISQKI